MADGRPLGLFDSGVGGLSVLREIRRLLPPEDLIYFADGAYVPYGPRPAAWIRRRGEAIVEFLIGEGAKAVVVACNTASAAALGHLRERFSLPIVGMVPAVKPAAAATRSGRIGVLATEMTINGDPFAEVVQRFAGDVEVQTVVGAGLVRLVEAGDVASPRAESMVRSYVEPLLSRGTDVIVLGCTHYPFLRPLIETIAGPAVAVLDPAEAVARQTRRVLEERQLLRDATEPGRAVFYTSGDVRVFRRVASQLLGCEVAVLAAGI